MVFCIGLLLAALVVEQFEDILEHVRPLPNAHSISQQSVR